jgi:hypothetical protein
VNAPNGSLREFPRPAEEWHGMLVDLAVATTCDETIHCGLALVCRGGTCLPCERDGECEAGMACVLDHCVAKERVSCRLRKECGEKAACILSGYSSDPRGNGDMRAYCLPHASGLPRPPEPVVRDRDPSSMRPNPTEVLLAHTGSAPRGTCLGAGMPCGFGVIEMGLGRGSRTSEAASWPELR